MVGAVQRRDENSVAAVCVQLAERRIRDLPARRHRTAFEMEVRDRVKSAAGWAPSTESAAASAASVMSREAGCRVVIAPDVS
jgi:hypothetical protein